MFKYLLFLGFIMSLTIMLMSCETSIEPIIEEGKGYSIYGPLNISESPNYLRVHNNKAILNPEGTLPMDANISFTNLDNGESEILEDQIIEFDGLYTHNFKIDMPIEFDTRYQVYLDDGEGITSTLTTVTTKESAINVLKDNARCSDDFKLQLSNINVEAGEHLGVEIGLEAGNSWLWTNRITSATYDSDENIVTFSFTPYDISVSLFGQFDAIECSEFSSDIIRFRFTHIGYMDGADQDETNNTTNLSQSSPTRQIVLSKYSRETELKIHPCEFDGNPESCINVN